MQAKVKLQANLDPQTIHDPYISLEFSGEAAPYVNHVSLPEVNSEVFDRLVKISQQEYRIYLVNSADARIGETSVFFKTKPLETPNQSHLVLQVSLKNGDGSVLKTSSQTLDYINVTTPPDYMMEVVGGLKQPGGISEDGDTLASTGLVPVTFRYTPNYDVRYRYDSSLSSSDIIGKRAYSKLVLRQPMPDHAVFDPGLNPGWTLDDHTLSFTFGTAQQNQDNGYDPVELKLTFPGAQINTSYQAESSMEFFPLNQGALETTIVLNKSVSYVFGNSAKPGNPFVKAFDMIYGEDLNTTGEAIVNNVPSRIQKGLNWNLSVTNTYAEPLYFTSFTDKELDPRLYYSGISLKDLDDMLFGPNVVSQVSVTGVLDDGSQLDLGTVSANRDLNFPEETAGRIQELHFSFPEDFALHQNERAVVKVLTKFRKDPVVEDDASQNHYANQGSYAGEHRGSNGQSYQVYGNGKDRFQLKDPEVNIGFVKYLSEDLGVGWFSGRREEPIRADGEYAIFELSENFFAEGIQGLSDSDTVQNLEIIDLLPEGLTYQTETINQNYSVRRAGATIEYKENYQDSGLNAVVFHFDSVRVSTFNRLINEYAFKIVTKVNSDSLPGKNENVVLVRLNNKFVSQQANHHMSGGYSYSPVSGYQDVRDLDQDGDTQERFAFTSSYYEYTGRTELIARKYIARANRDNFNRNGLLTGAQTDFRYRLFALNNKGHDISSFEIYDVLPYQEDITPAKDAKTNEYEKRNSAFSNTLTGPVGIAENANKYDIFYSTDPLASPIKDPKTELNWVSSVEDYSTVTAIKIQLKEGSVLKNGETLIADLPMKSPSSGALESRAYNDFVISSENSDVVPTNRVYNEMYIPSGILRIHKTDAKQVPLANAVFCAVSQSDSSKQYTLTTNEDGIAEATLPIGAYTVRETTAPDHYVLDDASQNVSIAESDSPELSVSELTFVNTPQGVLTLHKVDSISKEPLAGVEFTVFKDEQEIQKGMTDTDGTLVFEDLDYGTYTVKETKNLDTYLPNNQVYTVTFDKEHTEETIDVENTLAKGRLVIHKVNSQDASVSLQNASFVLKDQNDTAISEGKTDEAGNLVFEDLLYGDYQLIETTAPSQYLLKKDAIPVTVDQSEVQLTITNDPIEKTSFTVHKEWIGGPVEKPDITMELYQDDTLYDRQILTNGTLSYTWNDLPKTDAQGKVYTYAVKEKEVPYYVSEKVDAHTFRNTYIPRILTIHKVDSISKEPLAGVEFTIFKDEQEIQKGMTDTDGTLVFEDLDYGTYTVKETASLWNYEPVTDSFTVQIDAQHTDVTLDITNDLAKGKILVHKTDAKDKNKALSNVSFVLKDSSGQVIDEKSTNEDGDVYFEDLLYGAYQLEEVHTPDGYLSLKDPVEIFLNQKAVKINISNQAIETIDFDVHKIWEGGPDSKPDITFCLYQNDVLYDKKIMKHGTIDLLWADLPKTDKEGNEFIYRVEEEPLKGYRTEKIDDHTFRNTFIQEDASSNKDNDSSANDKPKTNEKNAKTSAFFFTAGTFITTLLSTIGILVLKRMQKLSK